MKKQLKTVNSISGGATSNYMYYHHPADYNIFACVCIDDHRCTPKDKGLLREIRKKIPNFIATAEADITLKNLIDLEQETGNEIIWVKGDSFDDLIDRKKALPNLMGRFCTVEMKMKPIFEYCFTRIFEHNNDEIKMRIGIRSDEAHRKVRLELRDQNGFKIPAYTNIEVLLTENPETGNLMRIKRKRQTHKIYYWRQLEFPLIESGITRKDILKFWAKKGYMYPIESNCVGCFYKSPYVLKEQFKRYPEKMQWFVDQEEKTGRTFVKSGKYSEFKMLQPSLFDLDQYTSIDFSCNCTD